jgi:hypothetical protein
MPLSRDSIQGFIDGYKNQGGDMTKLAEAVRGYLESSTRYPAKPEEVNAIVDDLGSYEK